MVDITPRAIGMAGRRRLYFLHIPRAGGTNLYANLVRIRFEVKLKHRNGNILDEVGNWLPFWYWDREVQQRFFSQMDLVVNEKTLGPFMFEEFTYLTCFRNPVSQRKSCFLLWAKLTKIPVDALLSDIDLHYRRFCNAFPSNLATRMIANRIDQHGIDETDYARAILRLSRINVLMLDRLAEDFFEFFGFPFEDRMPNTLKGGEYDQVELPDDFVERLSDDSVYDARVYGAVLAGQVGRTWKAAAG